MASGKDEAYAYVCSEIARLRHLTWAELSALGRCVALPGVPAKGWKYWLYSDERDDGGVRIVVQALGHGWAWAEGFIGYPDGHAVPVPEKEMWEFL